MKSKNQRNSDCHRGWLSTALQHPQVLDHASYFFTDWLIFKLLSFNIFQDRQNTDRNIDQWEASIIFLSANKIQLCDREPTLSNIWTHAYCKFVKQVFNAHLYINYCTVKFITQFHSDRNIFSSNLPLVRFASILQNLGIFWHHFARWQSAG